MRSGRPETHRSSLLKPVDGMFRGREDAEMADNSDELDMHRIVQCEIECRTDRDLPGLPMRLRIQLRVVDLAIMLA